MPLQTREWRCGSSGGGLVAILFSGVKRNFKVEVLDIYTRARSTPGVKESSISAGSS